MAINTTTRKAGPFAGNGVQTAFPFSFKIFSTADVKVTRAESGVETTLTLGVDYSVAMNGDQDASPGGTVNLTTALASGQTLAFTTDVAALQQVTVTNAGGFFPSVFNGVFDRITVLVQQILERMSRSFTVQITSGVTSFDVPVSALGLLQWNASGTGLQALDPNNLGLSVTLPSQTGKSGLFLTTNGLTPSWASQFPTQTGQSGKFLTTNGTTPSWGSPTAASILPAISGATSGLVLTNDGVSAFSWASDGYKGRVATATNYAITAADRAKAIRFTGSPTLSVTPTAATLGSTFGFRVSNNGTGIGTFDPNGTELVTVNGFAYSAQTLLIYPGEIYDVFCTSTAWECDLVKTAGVVLMIRENSAPSAVSGSWNDRMASGTVIKNTIGSAGTLPDWTLPAGTYEFEAGGGSYGLGSTALRVRNTTDSTTVDVGDVGVAIDLGSAYYTSFKSQMASDAITTTATKTYRLQQYVTASPTPLTHFGNSPYGVSNSIGGETTAKGGAWLRVRRVGP